MASNIHLEVVYPEMKRPMVVHHRAIHLEIDHLRVKHPTSQDCNGKYISMLPTSLQNIPLLYSAGAYTSKLSTPR